MQNTKRWCVYEVLIVSNDRTLVPLSVRTLLEFNEDNLRVHFKDAWQTQKDTESEQALSQFSHRISEIDSISDFHEKWVELAKGVLAGNVFDWGSAAVANILDSSSIFGLSHAMETIEARPWFIDDVDVFIQRLYVSVICESRRSNEILPK